MSLYSICMLILFIGFAFWAFKFSKYMDSSNFKGMMSEWAIKYKMNKYMDHTTTLLLDDILLKTEDGTSTQIDYIIIAPSGIYVVEAKFCNGYTTGSRNDDKWKIKYYGSGKTFYNQNPFNQNYKHIKAIESVLGIESEKLHNVVLYIGKKNKSPIKNLYFKTKFLMEAINSNKSVVIDDVEAVAKKIWDAQIDPSRKNKKAHVKALKKRFEENKESVGDKPKTNIKKCYYCKSQNVKIKNGHHGKNNKYLSCLDCGKNKKLQ